MSFLGLEAVLMSTSTRFLARVLSNKGENTEYFFLGIRVLAWNSLHWTLVTRLAGLSTRYGSSFRHLVTRLGNPFQLTLS